MSRREVIDVIESSKLSVFPVADSLGEAIQKIDLSLHEIPRARITPLISMYHNTLLTHIQKLIKELPND